MSSPRAWSVYCVPLAERLKNAGVGATIYNIDLGLLMVADDSLLLTMSETQYKIAEQVVAEYARDYYIIFENSKLNFNIWGTQSPREEAKLLTFDGYQQVIAEESTHVGVEIVQDQTQSAVINVRKRVAKTNSRSWTFMNKCWTLDNAVNILVHRELINTIVKPMLITGLQSLTISDNEFKPASHYQDVMIRRVIGQRTYAGTTPLELILQIKPLLGEFHKAILSLFYNLWSVGGPALEFDKGILRDRTLRNFWIHNVNRILKKLELLGATRPSVLVPRFAC